MLSEYSHGHSGRIYMIVKNLKICWLHMPIQHPI
jgi:hypothetical protein